MIESNIDNGEYITFLLIYIMYSECFENIIVDLLSLYYMIIYILFYSLDCREGLMKLNKFVCLFVCLFVTGQKNIFCMFLLLRSMSKKYGLGWDQKSKKHCFLPGSKVKKTFSMIFYFRAD